MSDGLLGTGAARNAAKAIRKRKGQIDAAADSSTTATPAEAPRPKMRDATKGAFRDRQMQEAIKAMKKAKSANRADYE